MRNFIYKTFLKLYKKYSRGRLYKDAEELIRNNLKKEGRYLSIGAGGGFSSLLKDKMNLSIIEIDKDGSRNPDVIGNMEKLDFIDSNSIDAIFCFEVLEHVENPSEAISESYRVLKKGGLFFGSTPFSFPLHEEPFDFNRFSKYALNKYFGDFQNITIIETSSYLESVSLPLLRLLVLPGILPKLVGILLLPLFFFLRVLSPLIKNNIFPTGYLFLYRKEK